MDPDRVKKIPMPRAGGRPASARGEGPARSAPSRDPATLTDFPGTRSETASREVEAGERLKAEGVWLVKKGNEVPDPEEKVKFYRKALDVFVRARAVLPRDPTLAQQIGKIETGIVELGRWLKTKGNQGA